MSISEAPEAPVAEAVASVPLCVDLDGTLTPSDTLHEGLVQMVASTPLSLVKLPAALLKNGKAGFKAAVTATIKLDAALLPYNEELLTWLREQKRAGRRILLVTAAHSATAEAVASHVGIFDAVISTTAATNLAGDAKAAALVERFGPQGFDYVGNAVPDLRIWAHARRAILVDADASVEKRARQLVPVERVFRRERATLTSWMHALRVHQWVKNVLVFVPLLLAHRFGDVQLLALAIGAFVAFCLCASSVYVQNDLWDLSSDRRHPRKAKRPFASASLSIRSGVAIALALLLGAFAIGLAIGARFVLWLAAYYAVTVAYNFWLKRISIVDVMSLAGLYTIRILAGAAAVQIEPSFWLLAFSMFLFLSLAVIKRYAELQMMVRQGKNSAAGRAYESVDLSVLLSLGVASGYCSVLVLALYIQSDQSQILYDHPQLLWLICPALLYWISRVWVLTIRGKMDDDPIVFALKDRISASLGLICALIAAAAL